MSVQIAGGPQRGRKQLSPSLDHSSDTRTYINPAKVVFFHGKGTRRTSLFSVDSDASSPLAHVPAFRSQRCPSLFRSNVI